MKYEDAKRACHVRSAIYRTGDPTKVFSHGDKMKCAFPDLNEHKVGTTVPHVYWKNHPTPLDDRIPDDDKLFDDWEEYDPREQPDCSAFNEMPA